MLVKEIRVWEIWKRRISDFFMKFRYYFVDNFLFPNKSIWKIHLWGLKRIFKYDEKENYKTNYEKGKRI